MIIPRQPQPKKPRSGSFSPDRGKENENEKETLEKRRIAWHFEIVATMHDPREGSAAFFRDCVGKRGCVAPIPIQNSLNAELAESAEEKPLSPRAPRAPC